MNTIIKIAYAEDHTLIRKAIIEYINFYEDCNVVADENNGKELIDKIGILECAPDVCILDISMPVMNGYDTIIYLKKSYPKMKFLVLSMYDTEFSVIRMIRNGANGYLLKNCDPADLHQAIVDIYFSGYYYDDIASEGAFKKASINDIPTLTKKELEFLSLCCSELSYAKIAELMHVSTRTVEDYQQHIGDKLNIHSRMGLALFAVQNGLVSLNG